MKVRLAHGSSEWTVEVGHGEVRLVELGARFVVRDLGGGRVEIEGSAGKQAAVSAVAGDTVWVATGGEALAFRIVRAGNEIRSTARDLDALMPPMSATVVSVHVRPGDRVRAGDLLVSLEAMKMELPIRAPRDAAIRAVRCAEGQLVEPGTPLIELDE